VWISRTAFRANCLCSAFGNGFLPLLQKVVIIQIWDFAVEGILVATILVMAAFLVRMWRRIRRHEDTLARARTAIVAAEDVARTKAAQWTSIIASMPDGLSVVDSDLRLVEWNEHMPEFAGVPSEILRVGWIRRTSFAHRPSPESSGRLTLNRKCSAVWNGSGLA
jgi:PAS domain-containing protein